MVSAKLAADQGMETESQTVDICDAAERQGGQAHVHFGNPLAMPDDAEDNSQALCRGQQSSTWPSPLSTLPKATVKHIDHQHRQVHCRGQQSSTLPSSSSTLPRAAVKHIDHQDRQAHCRGRMSTAEDSTALLHARPWIDETVKDATAVVKLKHKLIPLGQGSPASDKDKLAVTGNALKQVRQMNAELKARLKEHCVRHPLGTGTAGIITVISRLDALGTKIAEAVNNRRGSSGHAPLEGSPGTAQ